MSSALPGGQKKRRALARLGSALLWYVVPALAIAAVAAYIVGAVVGGANPPVVPVTGVSMRPTLKAGDLVFLEGVNPRTLRKGDIVAVHVPKATQQKYNLPANIVHRILRVERTDTGLVFHTKGDANAEEDVFLTHPNDVVGQMAGHVTGLGYPLLFFRSRQGEIFIAAAALLGLLYFGLGLFEDRRIAVEGTAATMQMVLDETHELRQAIGRAEGLAQTAGAPAVADDDRDRLAGEVQAARTTSEETSVVLQELVGAIGEYGTHLRSHTAVMQGLAVTTTELRHAAVELRSTLAGPVVAAPLAPERPAAGSEPPFDTVGVLGPELSQQRRALAERAQRVDRLLDELVERFAVGGGGAAA